MRLKDFAEKWEMFYDDFETIVQWSKHEGNEVELISLITRLTSELAEKNKKESIRNKEWCGMAFANLVPDILTTDPEILNTIRLAYISFDNKFFVRTMKNFNFSKDVWYTIEKLHPEIYEVYMKYKGNENE